MANPLKGETGFKAGGQDFTLLYDFNALCTIEHDLGVDMDKVGETLTSPSMIRSVFRIGLEAKHGTMSDLEAGNLIHLMGPANAAATIGKAFQAAFPEAEGNAPKPARKPAGTSPAR